MHCRQVRLVCPSPRPRALRLGFWRAIDVNREERLALLRQAWFERHALLDLERGVIVERLRADVAGPRLAGTPWGEPSELQRLDDAVEAVREPSDAVLCREACRNSDLLVVGLGGGLVVAELSSRRALLRMSLPEIVWVRIAGGYVFALDARAGVSVIAIDRNQSPRAWRRHRLGFSSQAVRSGVLGARFRIALEERGAVLAVGTPGGVEVVLDPGKARRKQRLDFAFPSMLRVLSRRRLLLASAGRELRIWPFDESGVSVARPSLFRI